MNNSEELRRGSIDFLLNELAKEIKKRRGRDYRIEIVIVGGAAILLNGHEFRQSTVDIDAYIQQNASISDCINAVADRFSLPDDWLNSDFRFTASFSSEIVARSKYYKQFRQCLTVRYISDAELIAMKLRAFRAYKHDRSDIVGILMSRQASGTPIMPEEIRQAVIQLYGSWDALSPDGRDFIEAVFNSKAPLTELYSIVSDEEADSLAIAEIADSQYKGLLNEDNVEEIIENIRRKRQVGQ